MNFSSPYRTCSRHRVAVWAAWLAAWGALASLGLGQERPGLRTIETLAGNGEDKFSGDGGPAVEASLRTPAGLAAAPEGGLYIADVVDRRVRLVDSSGRIGTVAGTGRVGSGELGEPATEADLTIPTALLLDEAGNLFITDADGTWPILMRVDPGGAITAKMLLGGVNGFTGLVRFGTRTAVHGELAGLVDGGQVGGGPSRVRFLGGQGVARLPQRHESRNCRIPTSRGRLLWGRLGREECTLERSCRIAGAL